MFIFFLNQNHTIYFTESFAPAPVELAKWPNCSLAWCPKWPESVKQLGFPPKRMQIYTVYICKYSLQHI